MRLLGVLLLTSLVAIPAHAEGPIERLSGALRFETISHQDAADFDPEPFVELHRYLAAAFPKTHATLELERVADYSLLFTWKGRDPALAPFLLTSHFDVVPVIPGTEERWSQPPFGGVVADGYVWGRGALDDKAGVLATLEAVEGLVARGFQPERTIYLAFGHDEELGGDVGAAGMTDLLESRGVRLWFSLDEGMAIADGIAGIEEPVAMIGIAEKGFLTLRLTAKAAGGHSSVPQPGGAIPRLARAVTRLDETPLPSRMGSVAGAMFDALGPHLPAVQGFLISQRWALGPLLESALSETPSMNAMIRTTTAITIVTGGVKANVLPTSATATANFRLVPGDTVAGVVDNVRSIIDDPEIEIEVEQGREASPVASDSGAAWKVIGAAVQVIAPGVIVAPALVLGGTDSKHYGRIAEDSYRFTPFKLGEDDFARVHGTNERIAVDDYPNLIRFYEALVQGAAGAQR